LGAPKCRGSKISPAGKDFEADRLKTEELNQAPGQPFSMLQAFAFCGVSLMACAIGADLIVRSGGAQPLVTLVEMAGEQFR
jgi:hypothetical protein